MSHLVPLAAHWQLWRWACLRATGFPARLLHTLASPALATAADHLLALEATAARLREQLVGECKAAQGRVDSTDRTVQRALRKLWQHRLPEPIADPAAEALRDALGDALAAVNACGVELTGAYATATHDTSAAIRTIARDDRFRQALLWQNRSAVHGGIDGLLRQPLDATDSKTRSKERLVASYVQRYCAKNDTIGFFGPCGWASFVAGAPTTTQRPGPGLLAQRTIYYEYWAIDALATVLSADPELRPFLVPRRLPGFRVEGTTLHYPIGKQAELPDELAAVAARCDGARSARAIASELGADLVEVCALLDELVESRVILWELEIPTSGPDPERALARLLAEVVPDELRARALAPLEDLDRHRTAIASAGDGRALEDALVAFDAAFTRLTGSSSSRADGQTYAGRTPIYEECRRDLELELGQPVLDCLGPPLELVLQSARWFTYTIARRYREALAAIYLRLRGDGDPAIDFARFWLEVPALFPGTRAPGSIVGDVLGELQQRWATLVAIAPAERHVQRDSATLVEAAHLAFAAPHPGWPSARHHSPDVMIAAAGPEALARGEMEIVLGELHAGFNTIAGPFIKLHPHPDQLVDARDADLAHVGIAPVWSKAVTGADYYSPSPSDLDLEAGQTKSRRPRDQVLATSELVVEARDGQLVVRTRDGRHRFDIIEFLEHHLIAESFAAFTPIPGAAWRPRVTIDRVVIARESWRVAPAELAWPAIEDASQRFLAARRWARSLGMPRWLFVKTPEEVKPVFVDLDSTVYVDMLAKQLRAASAATLSEMLPALDDTWIVDREGERYTGELRIAATDPERWQPERSPQLR